MKKPSRTLKQFYQILDDDVKESLDQKQKISIERAILTMASSQRHLIDMRHSFKFFKHRYYLVLLMGRDHRRQLREYSWSAILIFFVMIITMLSGIFFIGDNIVNLLSNMSGA